IVIGSAGKEVIPANLQWAEVAVLGDAQAELFKIRNRNDVVVGVASRISGTGSATGSVVEWTLHLPARGTLYANLQPLPDEAGIRSRRLRAGRLVFATRQGTFNDRIRADEVMQDDSGST